MRYDKEKAIDLRKQGKSYLQISRELNIPKGTLSGWFKNLQLSITVREQNVKNTIVDSTERMKKMNAARKINLDNLYLEIKQEADIQFQQFKKDPLFIAGLMLYAGEGDKTLKNPIRLANSDMQIVKVFKEFILKYLAIPKEKIKFWILLYPNIDPIICQDEWKEFLELEDGNFYKNQVIAGKSTSKRLISGVGNIIISSKVNKVRLLAWIQSLFDEMCQ